MNSYSSRPSRVRLDLTILAGVAALVGAFFLGNSYGERGRADVRKSCLVTEASAEERTGTLPGDFVDGDCGCIADELPICYSFDEVDLWRCSAGRSPAYQPYWAVDVRDRVTMILVMPDVLPLAEVKAKFSEMVDRVERQHDRITVTRNGRPAAVLMSADDLAALEDTLELLSDPAAMADIEQARRDVVAGNTVSADEIRAKYLHQ
jgi:prevent-host-death family protein